MLHGPVVVFRLRLFVSLSISFSCTDFTKNEFMTFFFKYLLNWYFAFGVFNARLEPILAILTKNY